MQTVWKFMKLSATQILRETNSRKLHVEDKIHWNFGQL